jgi:CDP-diglyceride synthetase
MKDLLFAVVGLIAAVIAVWQIWSFSRPLPPGVAVSNMPLFIGIFFALVALVCGGLFLSGRVNRDSDIHITE